MQETLVEITKQLARDVNELSFSEPIAYVYNPLMYAWKAHRIYLDKYGDGTGKVRMG